MKCGLECEWKSHECVYITFLQQKQSTEHRLRTLHSSSFPFHPKILLFLSTLCAVFNVPPDSFFSFSLTVCSFADRPQRRRARCDLYVVFLSSPVSFYIHIYVEIWRWLYFTKKLFYLLTLTLPFTIIIVLCMLNLKVAGILSLETIKI